MTKTRKLALTLLGLALLGATAAWIGVWLGYGTIPGAGSFAELYVYRVAVGAGAVSALAGVAALVLGIVSLVRTGRAGVVDLVLGVAALALGLTSGAAGLWMLAMQMIGEAH